MQKEITAAGYEYKMEEAEYDLSTDPLGNPEILVMHKGTKMEV